MLLLPLSSDKISEINAKERWSAKAEAKIPFQIIRESSDLLWGCKKKIYYDKNVLGFLQKNLNS